MGGQSTHSLCLGATEAASLSRSIGVTCCSIHSSGRDDLYISNCWWSNCGAVSGRTWHGYVVFVVQFMASFPYLHSGLWGYQPCIVDHLFYEEVTTKMDTHHHSCPRDVSLRVFRRWIKFPRCLINVSEQVVALVG